jgi:hypothetical protein
MRYIHIHLLPEGLERCFDEESQRARQSRNGWYTHLADFERRQKRHLSLN